MDQIIETIEGKSRTYMGTMDCKWTKLKKFREAK